MTITLKDISNFISTSTYIIKYQKIKYDNVNLPMKSKTLSYDEFKWLVEKSEKLASMLVDFISASDNNLYIGIY